MPKGKEREPREQETLIYATPEEAREFRERAGERLIQERKGSVRREREVIGEQVAREFEQNGESVETVKTPWEHTKQEHSEAQELVDLAFARDLPAALKEARASEHYPRNMDLFHDVLTGEMFDLVREHKLDEQPLAVWVMFIVGIGIMGILVGAILLFVM